MKTLISSLVILVVGLTAVAGGAATSDAEWLTQQQAQLAAVKSVTNATAIGLWSSGDNQTSRGPFSYAPKGDGVLFFEDKTWVLIVRHSAHTKDGPGDLTLVRASDGRFMVNRGHVCGNLLLYAPEKITSLGTFLKANGRTLSGESTPWEPYPSGQQGGGLQPPAAQPSTPTP